MALSKRGINRLEKIMLANAKRYNQNTFGELKVSAKGVCGTILCAAGFCYLLEVGEKQFAIEIEKDERSRYNGFSSRCLKAGRNLLGLTKNQSIMIFGSPWNWPEDLEEKFGSGSSWKKQPSGAKAPHKTGALCTG